VKNCKRSKILCFHCHAIKNEKGDQSIRKVQNLGNVQKGLPRTRSSVRRHLTAEWSYMKYLVMKESRNKLKMADVFRWRHLGYCVLLLEELVWEVFLVSINIWKGDLIYVNELVVVDMWERISVPSLKMHWACAIRIQSYACVVESGAQSKKIGLSL